MARSASRATAYPDREFQARLLSVGAVVDPQTRTVPLLAQTENPDDLLKLGMFVRIILDSSASEQVLTVPAGAVVEIETEKYRLRPRRQGRRPRGPSPSSPSRSAARPATASSSRPA